MRALQRHRQRGQDGRHFTFFEMAAHHVFNKKNKEIYFKDGTVSLCHKFFTVRMGVDPLRLRYIEEWWRAAGTLGRAWSHHRRRGGRDPGVHDVQVGPEGMSPMSMTVVGHWIRLERMTWVSQGTPSAYEAVFGPVVEELEAAGEREDEPQGPGGVFQGRRAMTKTPRPPPTSGASRADRDAHRHILRGADGHRRPPRGRYVISDHSGAGHPAQRRRGTLPTSARDTSPALLVRRALRSMRSLASRPLWRHCRAPWDYFTQVIPN